MVDLSGASGNSAAPGCGHKSPVLQGFPGMRRGRCCACQRSGVGGCAGGRGPAPRKRPIRRVNRRLVSARGSWPPPCDEERAKQVAFLEPQPGKEHVMIAAFALAVLGVAVLGTLHIAACAS